MPPTAFLEVMCLARFSTDRTRVKAPSISSHFQVQLMRVFIRVEHLTHQFPGGCKPRPSIKTSLPSIFIHLLINIRVNGFGSDHSMPSTPEPSRSFRLPPDSSLTVHPFQAKGCPDPNPSVGLESSPSTRNQKHEFNIMRIAQVSSNIPLVSSKRLRIETVKSI